MVKQEVGIRSRRIPSHFLSLLNKRLFLASFPPPFPSRVPWEAFPFPSPPPLVRTRFHTQFASFSLFLSTIDAPFNRFPPFPSPLSVDHRNLIPQP